MSIYVTFMSVLLNRHPTSMSVLLNRQVRDMSIVLSLLIHYECCGACGIRLPAHPYGCIYMFIYMYICRYTLSPIVYAESYAMSHALPLLRHLHQSCLHAPPCSRGGKRFVYIYIIYVLYVQIHIHILCICTLAPGSAVARAVKPSAFREEHMNDQHSLRT